jgi:glycosyltransferase involved in cell wall biosynthesis
MKVAIIRGPMLNKFEMQSYEPLKKYMDIIAFFSNDHFLEVDLIDLPKKELRSLEGIFGRPLSNIIAYPLRLAGYRHHMIGLEKELKLVDIAHVAETYHAFSYQAIKAKEKYKIKVVVTVWENIPFFVEDNWLFQHNLRHKIKSKVRESADLFVAVTQRAKEALIYEGVQEEKITIIPVGVDLKIFRPKEKNKNLMKKIGIDEDNFIVLFIGRFVWSKGVFDLIYAAKRLLEDRELDIEKIKFIFIGRGPEIKAMLELINKLGIEKNVIIAGNFSYSEIPEIHNLADIFVLPSIPVKNWQEQFGMVLVEALASGKPVISTLCGSIPEVIGNAGILIQPNDPLSLYYAIKKLIIDEDLREKYSKLARTRAEDIFNPEEIALNLKREYEKLIAR